MEYRNKVRCCLAFVKEHVKKNSTGYQQLAERLGVSVLTIKRQLNGDQISMSKLLALCDAAQIDFAEVWQKVESRKVQHNVFNAEQDHAFYYFPHLFRYFLELLSRNTPSKIEETWNISPASTHLYLRKLEELSLICLSEKNIPTMLMSKPIGFTGESLHVIKAIQKGLIDVSEKLVSPREDEPFVILKPMLLSEDLRLKMYQEIKELVSRYAELSERYYVNSKLPDFNLVICDYMVQEQQSYPDIIEVKDFISPPRQSKKT